MEIPRRFLDTQTLAPETFLVRLLAGEGLLPELVSLNTLVIRGAEPVLVDTGAALVRSEWLDRTFELVDPADVRWVFLSHDDVDHVGNLGDVLDRCPNATLVTNWFTVERMSGGGDLLPLERVRILNPGDSLVTADRTFTASVPPTFDSPTTRGLLDTSTGVYWAADSFAVGVPHEVERAGDLELEPFRESFLQAQRMLSPWHQWLDPGRYSAHVGELRTADIGVAVGAHGPAFDGDRMRTAFDLFELLAILPPAPLVGQPDLELLLGLLGEEPAEPSAA
ncbi:MAG: MBL fold metallo-hydrolase, partial [Acidimicrobiales bacterium]